MITKLTEACHHDEHARCDNITCRCPCHAVYVEDHLGPFTGDSRVRQLTNNCYQVGQAGRVLYIGTGIGYPPGLDQAGDVTGWWLALDDGVEMGEYDNLVDALSALLSAPQSPPNIGHRSRRGFWIGVRVLRAAMWLCLAAAVLDLIRQADQLAWPAAAAAISLLFAGAQALAYQALAYQAEESEGVRNHD